jgi:hypothetical protein
MRRVSEVETMINAQRNTRRKIAFLVPPRPPDARLACMLTLIAGQRSIDLQELTRAIASDCELSRQVTDAACQESGCPRLSVEQAIVLLGRTRLTSQLLSVERRHRKPAESAWGVRREYNRRAE